MITPKPFFVLFLFYVTTALLIEKPLGSVVAITYSITGILSPSVILFIYWLIGEK